VRASNIFICIKGAPVWDQWTRQIAVKKNHHSMCGNIWVLIFIQVMQKKELSRLKSDLQPDHLQHLVECSQQLIADVHTHISVLENKLFHKL
jgi:uncharacterized protein YegL